jgi:two-component system, NarL family, sensor histidine kinase DesK
MPPRTGAPTAATMWQARRLFGLGKLEWHAVRGIAARPADIGRSVARSVFSRGSRAAGDGAPTRPADDVRPADDAMSRRRRDPPSPATRTISARPVLAEAPYLWLPTLAAVALLLFLVGPLGSMVQQPIVTTERLLIYGGVVAFVAVYLWAIPADLAGRARGRAAPATALLALLALVISLLDRQPDWTVLFIATATAAGRITPSRVAVGAVAAVAVLAALVLLFSGRLPVAAVESAFETALVGLVVLSFSQLERTAHQLALAQAEVARLAADSERARIARDLHDLLGHSLSLIALKTELARRMLERDPRRAAAELTEIEAVARNSLRDVREAVAGYRQVNLDTELDGARMALVAAGIEVTIERPAADLDPSVDPLLGWIVREGITNVVRHSAASRCAITIEALPAATRLEIVDDGRGPDPRRVNLSLPPGSGLAGIRERVLAAGGELEAGRGVDGGFRLAVRVPVGAAPGEAAPGQTAVEPWQPPPADVSEMPAARPGDRPGPSNGGTGQGGPP